MKLVFISKILIRVYSKLVKLFLPQEFSFRNEIKNNLEVQDFVSFEDRYLVVLKNGLKVKIRNHLHSDYEVFLQIFLQREYSIVVNFFTLNFGQNREEIRIIDAGGNAGYTALYFLDKFPNSFVYGIEPELNNYNAYLDNVIINNFESRVLLYNCALSEDLSKKFSLDFGFRDSKDWAVTTVESEFGNVGSITIDEICGKNCFEIISILKIDIEGAERFIFGSNSNCDFLMRTQLIAMEIHDEYEIRDVIYEILRSYDFVLLEFGELVIGVNTLLAKNNGTDKL